MQLYFEFQELEPFKLTCEICNSKYLCLYKTQHYAMHREQELAKERKLSLEVKKIEPTEEVVLSGEGRMAAKKYEFCSSTLSVYRILQDRQRESFRDVVSICETWH